MKKNILICDDEKDIVAALKIYLKNNEYNIYEAYNGIEAMEIVKNNEIHLILLDIMMPEMDGIKFLNVLREKYKMPVIFLTAKSEDADIILGLEIGADDYITKPFNPVEVIARVKSHLRRYVDFDKVIKSNDILQIRDISLDDKSKKVSVDGKNIKLTPKEYGILKLLMRNQGKVFSPSEIYCKVWNEDAFGAEGTVAVHIRHLREKIEIDPEHPRYLKVVWGQGYKIE